MYHEHMRTTVNLDDDVAAAVDRLRRERSIGLSQAINELVRAGLTAKQPRKPFRQRSQQLGMQVDVTNVAEALDLLEGPTHR
jgi:metal-responsive CopG/Arc/MetJ family transcriptional regulator